MKKTSKELLQFDHKQSSSSTDGLVICNKGRNSLEEKLKPHTKPSITPLPKSLVLGKVKDFLGVFSEANKNLLLNAKDKPEEYDIEVLNGDESEYIEMDLMMGVADLQTPEAVAAAEAAVGGKQPIFDLLANGDYSESESESSSSDEDEDKDDDDNKDNDDKNEDGKAVPLREQSERGSKSKRPKIIELS